MNLYNKRCDILAREDKKIKKRRNYDRLCKTRTVFGLSV